MSCMIAFLIFYFIILNTLRKREKGLTLIFDCYSLKFELGDKTRKNIVW